MIAATLLGLKIIDASMLQPDNIAIIIYTLSTTCVGIPATSQDLRSPCGSTAQRRTRLDGYCAARILRSAFIPLFVERQ